MNIIRFADLCAQGKAQGQRVFIRADLNVPFDDHGHISEDTRIRASVPCIELALAAGAAVMVTSHLGRPTEGEFKAEDSLAPVAKRLGELLGREVPVVANWVGGVQVAAGQVVMLENCRVNKGEKKNNEDMARLLLLKGAKKKSPDDRKTNPVDWAKQAALKELLRPSTQAEPTEQNAVALKKSVKAQ